MRKTVLFDLDDTLYSELDFVRSGYQAAAELIRQRYGLTGDIAGQLWTLFEENPRRVFNRILDNNDICYSEEDVLAIVRAYREHDPAIKLFPDALQTLLTLKDMGCGLGMITDGYPVSQRKKLNALFEGKAQQFFDRIILTDELGKDYHKPDERAFIMMLEFFHSDWNKMVYVGDNPEKDFYIGNRYPILTVRLFGNDGVYKNSPYYEDIRELVSIQSLSELPEIIKRI